MALVRIEVGPATADVHSPWDPARIELIKTIPGRAWDKPRRLWTVPSNQVPSLKAALEAYGDQVAVIGAVPPPRTADSELTIARLEREKQRLQQEVIRLKNSQAASARNWAEQLLGGLTPDQAEKVHKALTRVLHPDVGGSTELMQQLNVARDLLGRIR